jgi:RNA dependent RNA polymerase
VNKFRPASLRHVDPPPGFEKGWFEKDERKAREVAPDGTMVNPDRFVSYGIKSSLVPVETGICSHRHRDVVYKHRSYEHPDALTLSWLLSNLVDAAKNGLTIRQSKFTDLLSRLGVPPPEYTKPPGERRAIVPTHIMDVLVMGVIPAFRDEVLTKFHQNVRKDQAMPIDRDIFAFYRLVKGKHTALVDRLRGELELVRGQWLKNVGKVMNDRSRQKDDLTCSPSKRARRVVSRQDTTDMVP